MLCSTAIRWLSQAISGHGAYISQDNRLIFLNNSLILAKGWSARLSRRRRWDFRPARGKPAARARARAFDRREIDIQKWRKCWVFALLFPVLARKSRSTAPRIVPNPRGIDPFGARLANLTSETSSQLTPPSSGESCKPSVPRRVVRCGGAQSISPSHGWKYAAQPPPVRSFRINVASSASAGARGAAEVKRCADGC